MIWKYNDRRTIRNPKTNYTLELDIWCPEVNLAIEYDGEHHFSIKPYGEKVHKYAKSLDKIKNKVCKEKKYNSCKIK